MDNYYQIYGRRKMMNTKTTLNTASMKALVWILMSFVAAQSWAFDSGSTGFDGAFSPTADTGLAFPSNGILNLTTLNIPAGVTVTVGPNPANGPAVILVQGDAVIDGVIDISGADGEGVGSAPAGFPGGLPLDNIGGTGQGPGGGGGGQFISPNHNNSGGHGGSYGSLGAAGRNNPNSSRGPVYGSNAMQPLLGGSGGGGTGIGSESRGYRGGGGGGAILIAVSKTLTLNGEISAKGGDGEPAIREPANTTGGPGAGGGSGGGVRLIATNFSGSGTINVIGGNPGLGRRIFSSLTIVNGGAGGAGRVRIEADAFNYSGGVTPSVAVTAAPSPVFVADLPTISMTTIGGSAVPDNPVGESDVVLPSSISNPVTVEFAATGVPLGSVVDLTVVPTAGTTISVSSSGLTGSVANSTASAQVALPLGPSVLYASVSFAAAGTPIAMFAPFTDGEMVARVELRSTLGGGPSSMRLTTESGRIIEVPSALAKL
jgi:hypothetical protein